MKTFHEWLIENNHLDESRLGRLARSAALTASMLGSGGQASSDDRMTGGPIPSSDIQGMRVHNKLIHGRAKYGTAADWPLGRVTRGSAISNPGDGGPSSGPALKHPADKFDDPNYLGHIRGTAPKFSHPIVDKYRNLPPSKTPDPQEVPDLSAIRRKANSPPR